MPELVGFTYHAQGIRIKGQWFPIVRMEWVEGTTLHTYVGQHVSEADRLRGLALRWRDLMAHLKANHIAHADLQHGNVLVTGAGELRLVDYDGMFVPDLAGQPSRELGHPNYQHPQRAGADYDERLDNFAALVIYLSLVALSYDPALWAQFHTGENLIFSESDFKAPQKSPVFERLYHSPERVVRDLSQRLILACEGTLARVPDFAQVLAGVPNIPTPQPWWQTESGAPPATRTAPAPAASASNSVPAASAHPPVTPHDTLPEWWKAAEKDTEAKAAKGKDMQGKARQALSAAPLPPPAVPAAANAAGPIPSFALLLARLWNYSRVAPLTGAAQTHAAPVPASSSPAAPSRSVDRRRPRRVWPTCSSVSCLIACLSLYGLIMVAQGIMRAARALMSPPRHSPVTIRRAPMRPLTLPPPPVHPPNAPPLHPGLPAEGGH